MPAESSGGFCCDRAGLVGEDGPTHHGIFDFAYTTHIPILQMAPKDKYELQIMLKWAFSVSGPCLRYPKAQVTVLHSKTDPELKWEVRKFCLLERMLQYRHRLHMSLPCRHGYSCPSGIDAPL